MSDVAVATNADGLAAVVPVAPPAVPVAQSAALISEELAQDARAIANVLWEAQGASARAKYTAGDIAYRALAREMSKGRKREAILSQIDAIVKDTIGESAKIQDCVALRMFIDLASAATDRLDLLGAVPYRHVRQCVQLAKRDAAAESERWNLVCTADELKALMEELVANGKALSSEYSLDRVRTLLNEAQLREAKRLEELAVSVQSDKEKKRLTAKAKKARKAAKRAQARKQTRAAAATVNVEELTAEQEMEVFSRYLEFFAYGPEDVDEPTDGDCGITPEERAGYAAQLVAVGTDAGKFLAHRLACQWAAEQRDAFMDAVSAEFGRMDDKESEAKANALATA